MQRAITRDGFADPQAPLTAGRRGNFSTGFGDEQGAGGHVPRLQRKMIIAIEVTGGDVSQAYLRAANRSDTATLGGDAPERGDNPLAHLRLSRPIYRDERIAKVGERAYLKRARTTFGPTH